MTLYFVRHGLAIDREHPDCPEEAERYLTKKGVKKTLQVAQALKRSGLPFETMVSSPYRRALQTAWIFADVFERPHASVVVTETLLPQAGPRRFFHWLQKKNLPQPLIVGHAPNIDALMAYALGSQRPLTALKKSGVACLEMRDFAPGSALLRWLLTPRFL